MVNESEQELLDKIKALTASAQYRVRIHAVRHMIEEGFSESDLIAALTGTRVKSWSYTLTNGAV